MKSETVYDIIGIGIGPFNLGLAALANDMPDLKCKFFDKAETFNWHPGLLLPNTCLQVPFYADLVTLADPTSKFTYLNYLKSSGNMFRFAIRENNFITRIEYNQYCKWVISQLPNLLFNLECQAINYDKTTNFYTVYLSEPGGLTVRFHAKHIIIGVGTAPSIPDCASDIDHPLVSHSSDYLFRKTRILASGNISIIGSGQSAAEIFYDLLQYENQIQTLAWFTRAEYIYPMDNSKFAYEMSTPDYIRFFYNLPDQMKSNVLHNQDRLYKGVNKELIDAIYERLCQINSPAINIFPNSELDQMQIDSNDQLSLQFFHTTREEYFEYKSSAAILATGYKNVVPQFLQPLGITEYRINKNYSLRNHECIFVQNADLHSHGFNSADLGLGPYRNAIILNSVLNKTAFTLEKQAPFQKFDNTDLSLIHPSD